MIIPESIIRRFGDTTVYDRIQQYRVRSDSDMPIEYRKSAGGRWKHDDWAVGKDTPRQNTAYRPMLPFKCINGKFEKKWMIQDVDYPLVPGTPVEILEVVHQSGKHLILPHILVDCAVEGGGHSEFACLIDGEWVKVYSQYRKYVNVPFKGRYLLATYSGGLKQDLTVALDDQANLRSDVSGWVDPPTMSFNYSPVKEPS